MKEAYKSAGYEIACKWVGDMKQIHIETSSWHVMCIMKNLPRKVLSLIVEHLGEIPEAGQILQVKKKEAQTKIFQEERDAFAGVTPDDCINPPAAIKTRITYKGQNVWHTATGAQAYWVDPDLEDIMVFSARVYCLGEKTLTVTGTVSDVSIVPTKPQTAEDRRVLQYLAGIRSQEK